MQKRQRKGFTIVELVIVIGVIGILTAILIPTFLNLNWKAGEASNQSYIKDLNTQMAIRENQTGEGGGKNNTMNDAVLDADEIGFNVEKLYPVYNRDIVWNSESNRFSLLNEDGSVFAGETDKDLKSMGTKIWKIASDASALTAENNPFHFSIYAREGWITSDIATKTISNLTVGFDVGKNTDFAEISYVRTDATQGQSALIRTNGGVLNINAPMDTVVHYGALDELNIIAVANQSYHEYGNVLFAAIKTGHVSFEEKSSIQAVHIVKNEETGQFDSIIISYKAEVEQPEYSRDACTIAEGGTKVCTLALPEETNNIILFKQGIYEQIKLQSTTIETEQESTSTEAQVWITDLTTATQETKVASDQLANVFGNRESALVEVQGQDEPELTEDRDFAEAEKAEMVVVEKPTAEQKKAEVLASVYVQAQVDPIDVKTTPIEFSLFAYNTLANSAELDVAYNFKAFTDEDFALMEKFIGAVDEDGNAIFGVDNIDINSLSEENINKALAYVENTYGVETKDAIVRIINQKTPYFEWLADFEISFDRDIEEGSVALAGHYGAFADNFYSGAWLGFGLPAISATSEPVRLLGTMYKMYHIEDLKMPYIAILAIVQQFRCGAANLSAANVGTTMTVDLCIYNYDDDGNQTDRIVCGTYKYTFGEVSEGNASRLFSQGA